MSFFCVVGSIEKKMSEKNWILLFCEKRKSVGIMKKLSCVDFLLKKSVFCGVLFREDSFRDIIREKRKKMSMMRAMYQAANVIKAWWSLCQWSSKNWWVKPTWAMTHDSLYNKCQDKRTSNIMRCFAGSMRRSWEDVVWSRGVGVNLTYTLPEESHKLDGIWDEIMIDFFEFPKSMNREETVNGWRRYSLWVMKKCNDDIKIS
jgi:hypothetical protein